MKKLIDKSISNPKIAVITAISLPILVTVAMVATVISKECGTKRTRTRPSGC